LGDALGRRVSFAVTIAVFHDAANRLVRASASGILTRDALAQFVRMHWTSENYRYLFDARRAGVDLTESDIQKLANESLTARRIYGSERPLAIVVSTLKAFNLARLYQQLCELNDIRFIGVFASMEEAKAWLATESRPRRRD